MQPVIVFSIVSACLAELECSMGENLFTPNNRVVMKKTASRVDLQINVDSEP